MATTPGNAINESTTGICGFTGTAFTATAVTQYDVIVGGATSSTLASVGPGSAGQVLQSGGNAANPAYSTATYPSTAGTSGNILKSDGTNWISSTLASTGAFTQINIQTFTVSGAGTYTPTSGMKYCIIEVLGGGGGGGSTTASGTAQAGGGGGGEYARAVFTAATIGVSKSVTVGAGGTAGNAGGTTSVGSTLISAVGGGAGSANNVNSGAPGIGGTGGTTASNVGAAVRCQGMKGYYGSNPNSTFTGGSGADSQFGSGGTSAAGGNFNGANGGGFGAGGSGAVGSSTTGGTGSVGLIIITEFISV